MRQQLNEVEARVAQDLSQIVDRLDKDLGIGSNQIAQLGQRIDRDLQALASTAQQFASRFDGDLGALADRIRRLEHELGPVRASLTGRSDLILNAALEKAGKGPEIASRALPPLQILEPLSTHRILLLHHALGSSDGPGPV